MVGEPLIKMIRYQQQYSFFDQGKVGKEVRFINLSDISGEGDLDAVLKTIVEHATAANAGLVVLDSFRILARQHVDDLTHAWVRSFLYRLGQLLVGIGCTGLLVGEYAEDEVRDDPIFAMVDGIIWLSQVTERNSVVRKLQVTKLRGQATAPGLHTLLISDDGLRTFSRTLGVDRMSSKRSPIQRLALGVTHLDEMLGGGIFEGDSLLIAGRQGRESPLWQPSLSPRDSHMANPAS